MALSSSQRVRATPEKRLRNFGCQGSKRKVGPAGLPGPGHLPAETPSSSKTGCSVSLLGPHWSLWPSLSVSISASLSSQHRDGPVAQHTACISAFPAQPCCPGLPSILPSLSLTRPVPPIPECCLPLPFARGLSMGRQVYFV